MNGNTQGNQSEVSQIRERIAREHQMAMWAQTGLQSGTARHRYINRRMENIAQEKAVLDNLVGSGRSNSIVTDILESDHPPRSH